MAWWQSWKASDTDHEPLNPSTEIHTSEIMLVGEGVRITPHFQDSPVIQRCGVKGGVHIVNGLHLCSWFLVYCPLKLFLLNLSDELCDPLRPPRSYMATCLLALF